MVPKAGLRTRLRYWFDNTMSRGTPALIGWLAIVSAGLIVVVSIALAIATANESILNVFDLLWQTFVSAFSVDIPDNGGIAVHAIWFLLALGGIFVVSALVGLLTSGLNQKLEELRRAAPPSSSATTPSSSAGPIRCSRSSRNSSRPTAVAGERPW